MIDPATRLYDLRLPAAIKSIHGRGIDIRVDFGERLSTTRASYKLNTLRMQNRRTRLIDA